MGNMGVKDLPPQWIGIVPSPDPGFVKKLHTFDPTLKCQFSRKLGKFVITQPNRLHSGESVAAIVEGDTGAGYRQPDNRDIKALYEADFEIKDHKRRILEGEEAMLEHEKNQEERVAAEIRDITLDSKYQLRNTYVKAANEGKGMAPFRQVTVKPKGKVFSQEPAVKVIDRRKVK